MSFAPGHISTHFTIHHDTDPLRAGSTGGGVCLPWGAHAEVEREPAAATAVTVTPGPDPVTARAVELVLTEPARVRVAVRRELPLGAGLGMSGASALAACLALGVGHERATSAAHRAEVEHNSGLGDVVAQAASLRDGGGARLVLRRTPGAMAEVATCPVNGLVLCLCGAGRSTGEVLGDPAQAAAITAAGRAVELRMREPTLRDLLAVGHAFTVEAGLMPAVTQAALTALPPGAVGTVAHLGTAVVATGDDLDANDLDAIAASLAEFGPILRC